jgi:tetratricopeptide (TPR) repeat protein
MTNPRFLDFKKLGVLCLLLTLSFANLRAASNDVSIANLPPPDSASNEALRAYLQLQEQIHDTQLTIERNRLQAQIAAAQDSIVLSNRLHAIEENIAIQRSNDLDEAQRMSHMLMGVLAIFATVGFAAIMLMVYFQSRAVTRLAEISTTLAARREWTLPTGALQLAEPDAMANGSVEKSNARLAGLVQHLEKRIAELEQTAALPLKQSETPVVAEEAPATLEPEPGPAPQDNAEQFGKLLERGQTLLTADRPEEAIGCFDEILAAEPNHAEALVKKGTALEKLRQPQEALECYDRAIAADNTLTIAYLHKGGLCSRLEKYNEAMECYERALHTQEKKQAA